MTPSSKRLAAFSALVAVSFALAFLIEGCGSGLAPAAPTESDSTPPADSIGEALFLDTRFGQFFAANMTGVNSPLARRRSRRQPGADTQWPAARPIRWTGDQLPLLPFRH